MAKGCAPPHHFRLWLGPCYAIFFWYKKTTNHHEQIEKKITKKIMNNHEWGQSSTSTNPQSSLLKGAQLCIFSNHRRRSFLTFQSLDRSLSRSQRGATDSEKMRLEREAERRGTRTANELTPAMRRGPLVRTTDTPGTSSLWALLLHSFTSRGPWGADSHKSVESHAQTATPD